MKIIAKGRGKGKTTELIKMSAEKQIPIVCATSAQCKNIVDRANGMKLKIPNPIKCTDLKGRNGKVLIDDCDFVMKNIFCNALHGIDIEAITMSSDDYNELETDDIKDTYSESIKGLKDDAKSLTKQLKNLVNTGKHNEYIACLKALKETMNLIHEYDWQPQFSKYRVNDKENSGSHYEVATWEQNSDNEIRNHKRYELKSPEELNKAERCGISCVNGEEHTMTNEEINEFEDKFDREFNDLRKMLEPNLKFFDQMNNLIMGINKKGLYFGE
jgi:hypothetical protein